MKASALGILCVPYLLKCLLYFGRYLYMLIQLPIIQKKVQNAQQQQLLLDVFKEGWGVITETWMANQVHYGCNLCELTSTINLNSSRTSRLWPAQFEPFAWHLRQSALASKTERWHATLNPATNNENNNVWTSGAMICFHLASKPTLPSKYSYQKESFIYSKQND